MKEMRVLSPTAILGYGFPMASFEAGMALKPHCIAVDAGSTDPGPYYLGEGVSFTDRNAVKRDLTIMITAAKQAGIPVLIGTAGGSGADSHLNWCVEIVEEIARNEKLNLKTAIISAEIPKDVVKKALNEGRITPLTAVPDLTEEAIDQTTRIVAQMGLDPFLEALSEPVDVIIAGRAYDPAVFAALPVKKGFNPGLALHMGKILECACIASTPGSGSDCMMGVIGKDYFKVFPLDHVTRKCTTLSVAAHTLYEKSNPYLLPGPGGIIDLNATKFTQVDDYTVKVSGSKFVPTDDYAIKLEGAICVGYRTVSIAGARDPIMINQIDDIIATVKDRVKQNFGDTLGEYRLDIKVYGKNGVMGNLEPIQTVNTHELGIVIDVVAAEQSIANTVCSFARSSMLHYGYEGRISTAGNLAFPYSPSDFKAGSVYEFSIYHLMKLDGSYPLFEVQRRQLTEEA